MVTSRYSRRGFCPKVDGIACRDIKMLGGQKIEKMKAEEEEDVFVKAYGLSLLDATAGI